MNVLKPPGMTSSDAVADARHIFKIKRIGHTGTLDPGAAGVLPLCIGRATRLFDLLVDKQKEYLAELCFGCATDTQDSYGTVTQEGGRIPSLSELQGIFPRFTGEIQQIAPMYSAVSVDGKRLYQLAREGAETVERVRDITVSALEVQAQTGDNRYLLRVKCSRGTYVRTLCHDIGQALGAPAHLSFLLRTRSGEFCIDQAYSLAQLRQMREEGCLEQAVIPMERVLCHMGQVRFTDLSQRGERLLRNGAEITHDLLNEYAEQTELRVYVNGDFLGVGLAQAGALHMKLNLNEGGAQ